MASISGSIDDDPRRVGRKALAVNLSDLAAMAAKPLAAVISIALPRDGAGGRPPLELAIALVRRPAAAGQGVRRGNCRRRHEHARRAAGDQRHGVWRSDGSRSAHAQRRPAGRLAARDRLAWRQYCRSSFRFHAARARGAACCTSDTTCTPGWTSATVCRSTLSRLAEASGCGAVDRRRTPSRFPRRPEVCRIRCRHALGDGEDFELLLAVPPEVAMRSFCRINRLTARSRASAN